MNKLLSQLGLAMRAGALVSGDEAVLKSIRSGDAKLVLLAKDASDKAIKKHTDKCSYYKVPVVQLVNRSELGRSIGKEDRVVVAIIESGFAKMIRESAAIFMEVEQFDETR